MKAGIGTWALRIFLAVAFLFFGLLKFREGDGSLYVRIFELIGFGQWFRYFTGVVEVGLGIFSGEWHPGHGLDHGETLRESIDQVVHAERVGLDSVWVSEHHFHEAQFVGSVAPYAAAMIQATTRITVDSSWATVTSSGTKRPWSR